MHIARIKNSFFFNIKCINSSIFPPPLLISILFMESFII